MRKLPVYLLLDTSGSMYGEPVAAVKAGLDTLVRVLRQDPYALETVHLSVITFANTATQAVPLTEITDFQAPCLEARGQTSLGAALELLAARMDREVARSSPGRKGDWKPLVFIMSDGSPTDSLDRGIAALKSHKPGMVVACAAGPNANIPVLRLVTDSVVRLDSMSPASIMAFFQWVSASIGAGSARAEAGTETGALDELPPLPDEVIVV